MNTQQIPCKSALSPSRLPGLNYSLNPYRGCQHNCAYCYAPSILHCDRNSWGTKIGVKRHLPRLLASELRQKKSGVIGLSTVTDPYQPIEQKFRITRYCLEQLIRHEYPVCIQTKSKLILRDSDLISKLSHVEVMVSIGTLNEQEKKIIEPGSSSIADRLKVVKAFSEQGIHTSVFFGPVYPSIHPLEIHKILEQFKEAGVHKVMIDQLHFRPGVYESLKNVLQHYPNLQEKLLLKNKGKTIPYQQMRTIILDEAKKLHLFISDAF